MTSFTYLSTKIPCSENNRTFATAIKYKLIYVDSNCWQSRLSGYISLVARYSVTPVLHILKKKAFHILYVLKETVNWLLHKACFLISYYCRAITLSKCLQYCSQTQSDGLHHQCWHCCRVPTVFSQSLTSLFKPQLYYRWSLCKLTVGLIRALPSFLSRCSNEVLPILWQPTNIRFKLL